LLEVTNLETGIKKLYEGMFLIDSAEAAKDWDGILELVKKMLAKADAEVVSIRKWDELPLAYTIRRCGRGTYILTYFRADGPKIRDIERDVQLSERIMRALILKADHLTEEDLAKETSAMLAHTQGPQSVPDKSGQTVEPQPEQGKPADLGELGRAATDNVPALQ
jgi:small subunit ribosomal protein S6